MNGAAVPFADPQLLDPPGCRLLLSAGVGGPVGRSLAAVAAGGACSALAIVAALPGVGVGPTQPVVPGREDSHPVPAHLALAWALLALPCRFLAPVLSGFRGIESIQRGLFKESEVLLRLVRLVGPDGGLALGRRHILIWRQAAISCSLAGLGLRAFPGVGFEEPKRGNEPGVKRRRRRRRTKLDLKEKEKSMRMAKWPRVETPLDGARILAPVPVTFPKNAPGQVGLVVTENKMLYPQQKRRSESPTKNDGEKGEVAPGCHPLPT